MVWRYGQARAAATQRGVVVVVWRSSKSSTDEALYDENDLDANMACIECFTLFSDRFNQRHHG